LIPSFAPSRPQRRTNFGIGTLGVEVDPDRDVVGASL
jgi:hypothetical protein